jgi:hypothetical protein
MVDCVEAWPGSLKEILDNHPLILWDRWDAPSLILAIAGKYAHLLHPESLVCD